MTSPSTYVSFMGSSRRRISAEESHDSGRPRVEDADDDGDDPLIHLRPDPDNGNIQEDFTAESPMLPRRVPMIVVNDRPSYTPFMVESMRRKLRFFFMNPVEKWKARRQFPWKLLLQIIKIVVVTVQLVLFGYARYSHINFYEDNHVALSHLFLKDWDSSREVESYPPNEGPYAIYTKDEFYDHINYAVTRYANIREVAIGSYDYVGRNLTQSPLKICKTYYRKAVIWGFNESFIFDSSPEERCLDVTLPIPVNSSISADFNSKAFFAENNFTIQFDRLINLEVKFSLKYILLKALAPMDSPDCYQFDINVLFDDQDHDGQARVSLGMIPDMLDCREGIHLGVKYALEIALLNVLNGLVIFICFLSFILCSRAIIRAQALKYETVQFFRNHFGKRLTVNDKLEFLNMWYVMIIINDALIIVGSAIKIQIENKVTDGDLYNACSALLGTGSLLVWIGVLRYLGFFQKYNILLLTMRKAVPDVLRFLLCALMLYSGFIFCGWLILGPYHIKFRSLSSTAECLFSLINGDDMFATFTIISVKSGLVWWISRIYMYSFISLFIYVVLSLFIAVIMDTYETIKMCYESGFPKSDLMEFVSECRDDIHSGIFRQESVDAWSNFSHWLRHCCKRSTRRRRDSERQPLLEDK